jgi:hypothetical protein
LTAGCHAPIRDTKPKGERRGVGPPVGPIVEAVVGLVLTLVPRAAHRVGSTALRETAMRRLTAFLLVVVTVVFNQSRLPAADKESPTDLYPLKLGNKWHYRVDGGAREGTMVIHIAKIEKIDDQMLARLEGVVRGKTVISEHLASTEKGVFRHRINGIEISPALCLIKYPVKDGESWETEIKVGEEMAKAVCRVGKDEIEVPAGKYKTVTVKVDIEQDGAKFTSTYWFVAGVGIVKQTFDIGGVKATLELEKFEAGK